MIGTSAAKMHCGELCKSNKKISAKVQTFIREYADEDVY